MSEHLFRHPVPFWCILLLGAVLWGGEYIRRDLWEPDEARYALVSREMQEGHWLVPFRQGEFYSHKPPLMFWLTNAFSVFTGGEIRPWVARMPSYLGAVLALWSITRLAACWFSIRAAWLVLLLAPSTALFWNKGGFGQIDMLLCGLEMLALYALFSANGRHAPFRLLGAYVAMGLAILAKGPVGLLVPLGVYLTATMAARDRWARPLGHWIWGPLIALIFPAAWLGAAWIQGAPEGYFSEVLFKQNVGRVAGEFGGHNRPFYYFLMHFPVDFLPWTVLLPLSWVALRLKPEYAVGRRRLLAWIVFVILFFSLSASKRNLYILLAYPAAALLVAAGVDAWPAVRASWIARSFHALRILMILLGVGLTVASVLPQIPFQSIVLLPAGLILLAGAVFSSRLYRAAPAQPRWLTAAAAGFLASFAAVGAIVFPAVDDLKTPDELIEVAHDYLAPHERIIIYDWHGEIVSLYAQRKGFMADDLEELRQFIQQSPQDRHLIVTKERNWPDVAALLNPVPDAHSVQSGSKKLVWAKVDRRDTRLKQPQPTSPPST